MHKTCTYYLIISVQICITIKKQSLLINELEFTCLYNYYYNIFPVADSTCDTTIDPTNMNQYIVWAVGGLGKTAFKHFTRASSKYIKDYFL